MTAPRDEHCELLLVPYLRDELAPNERSAVDRHLGDCSSCRESLDGFRTVLAGLRAESNEPPEIDWRRYRSELRAKQEVRSIPAFRRTIPRLVPLVAMAAIAVIAVVFTLRGDVDQNGASEELPVFEQATLGSRLDLLKHYDVVENLDLLEDLDFVEELEGSAAVEEG